MTVRRALVAAVAVVWLWAAAPPAGAQEPMADLGWLLRGSGSMTCGKLANHLVCHAVAPDIQPPQVVAYGAVEPWLPALCSNFTLKAGDNAGRPAEVTVYGQGFPSGRGCTPGDPQSTDRGFCLLTIAADGRHLCDYEGANLAHLPGVWMEAVDVFGQPQFGWSWGTRFFIP